MEKIWEVYLKDGKIKELKKKGMVINNEKNINKFDIFDYFNSLCIS